jgi:hypothetical protein
MPRGKEFRTGSPKMPIAEKNFTSRGSARFKYFERLGGRMLRRGYMYVPDRLHGSEALLCAVAFVRRRLGTLHKTQVRG